MELRTGNPTNAYVAVLDAVLDAPLVYPRGLAVREVQERVTVVIDRPWELVSLPSRKLNHAISVVEGLSLVGQCSVPEFQTDRVKVFKHFVNDGVLRGSYGPRVEGGLADVVRLLRDDAWSRQAVLSIYDSARDLGRWHEGSVSGDVPCTLDIQFMLRPHEAPDLYFEQALHMWVTMRSNDSWRGTPYDFGQFMILHHAMAQALNVPVGSYTHSVGSLHLYEEHNDLARDVVSGWPLAINPTAAYKMWGADDIATIAERARRILMGFTLDEPTRFEDWMVQTLDLAEHFGQVNDLLV